MPSLVLAIDYGSSEFKAGLFDPKLLRIADHSISTPYVGQDADQVELDPENVWQATIELIKGICRRAGVEQQDVGTVAVTSQAQTFTLINADGNPILPLISWLDRRATAECQALEQELGPDFHKHCSFPKPIPQLQLVKMLWLKTHRPETLAENHSVAFLPSFIARRLAGINVTDQNLAAMSGMFSLQRNDWWPEALEICGIVREQLPGLVRVGEATHAASHSDSLDLPKDLLLVSAGNDQTSGAFGSGCRLGELIVTLGTALVVYRLAGDTPGPFTADGCWGPYPGGGFYDFAARDEGCLALDWAREQLMPGESVETFMAAAERAAGGVNEQTAFFYPERIRTSTAWSDGRAVEQMAFSAVEGITFSLRQLLYDDLRCDAASAITAIGGGAHSDFWLQLVADVTGARVHRGNGDSLLGAARMAVKQPPAVHPPDRKAFEPGSAARRAIFTARYKTWLESRRS